ncbi:MAG: hypothetical protein QM737_18530 [Ferruginibacter sp.]
MEKMKHFLKWLNDNQWLNLIFLVLAILSIILSFYLFIKSKKKKRPQYSKRSINVISDKIQSVGDIKISYQGKNVNNLTVTKIVIFNSGNETINNDDQAASDKLRIIASDGVELLGTEVLFMSSSANNINFTINDNVVDLQFDYLDPNQGFIIKIIHSGKNSSALDVKGTFKSSGEVKEVKSTFFDNAILKLLLEPSLPRLWKAPNKKTRREVVQTFPWVALITGIFLTSSYYFMNSLSKPLKITLVIAGVFYIIIGLAMFSSRKTLPSDFDSFYDDE